MVYWVQRSAIPKECPEAVVSLTTCYWQVLTLFMFVYPRSRLLQTVSMMLFIQFIMAHACLVLINLCTAKVCCKPTFGQIIKGPAVPVIRLPSTSLSTVPHHRLLRQHTILSMVGPSAPAAPALRLNPCATVVCDLK